MKTIALTRGYFAMVDDADYDDLMKYKWYLSVTVKGTNPSARRYAGTEIGENGKKRIKSISMQRHLLGNGPKELIDHINRNALDNRRSNLRFATICENSRNKAVKNKTGIKGVFKNRYNGLTARIRVNGKRVCLGTFHSEEAARRAYISAATNHFGEFACASTR